LTPGGGVFCRVGTAHRRIGDGLGGRYPPDRAENNLDTDETQTKKELSYRSVVHPWLKELGIDPMECLAVIAASVGVIFAKFADMQELNPFFWGILAVVVYAGAPALMIYRGASWMDSPWIWASSFGALAVLFVVQSIVAANRRRGNR